MGKAGKLWKKGRSLYIARGSSSCWGIPGLAPQTDGSWNAVPDEGNTACPSHGQKDYDYSQALIVGLNYDYQWDFLHKLEKQAGEIQFIGRGKKTGDAIKWQYHCITLDGGDPSFKVSCNERAPTHSYAKYAYTVTIENAD